jgi:hypothetical protein
MKRTATLTILCSSWIPDNRLTIHPNEGADLGLMMTQYWVDTGQGARIELCLRNECPKESVEIGPKFWERLGKPAKAVLGYDGSVLTIEKA